MLPMVKCLPRRRSSYAQGLCSRLERMCPQPVSTYIPIARLALGTEWLSRLLVCFHHLRRPGDQRAPAPQILLDPDGPGHYLVQRQMAPFTTEYTTLPSVSLWRLTWMTQMLPSLRCLKDHRPRHLQRTKLKRCCYLPHLIVLPRLGHPWEAGWALSSDGYNDIPIISAILYNYFVIRPYIVLLTVTFSSAS